MAGVGVSREGLMQKLNELGVDTITVEHSEVFTVDQALPYVAHLDGIFAKNLFLKDKKQCFWLFCAPYDANVKLSSLAKMVGASGGLRFADERSLLSKLGLTQGAVTVFGLINDTNHEVKLILDSRLLDGTYRRIYFHPLVNNASTGITHEGLLVFLQATGHDPIRVEISTNN